MNNKKTKSVDRLMVIVRFLTHGKLRSRTIDVVDICKHKFWMDW